MIPLAIAAWLAATFVFAVVVASLAHGLRGGSNLDQLDDVITDATVGWLTFNLALALIAITVLTST